MNSKYVSFKKAKELKEKGFDGSCRAYYRMLIAGEEGVFHENSDESIYHNSILNEKYFAAPTIEEANSWEKHIYLNRKENEDIKEQINSLEKEIKRLKDQIEIFEETKKSLDLEAYYRIFPI